MGKKSKTKGKQDKADALKLEMSQLPGPPLPVEECIGSAKVLDGDKVPEAGQKILDGPGYDDGGMGDLSLILDLDEEVMRRKRGNTQFFLDLRADKIPRIKSGSLAQMPRREQKLKIANHLFSEEDPNDPDSYNPSDVYQENVGLAEESEALLKARKEHVNEAKYCLKLSTVLREPATESMSLSELCKRYILAYGKDGVEAATRCGRKAILIASDGFYDRDLIAMEAEQQPVVDPKYEENATTPGLRNPASLKYTPIRVSDLCYRSAYLQLGNALMAGEKYDEAREAYENVLPFVEKESRCARVDWERCSILVNIGNTYSRQGNYEKASGYYDQAAKLAQEHIDADVGTQMEGYGMMVVSKRSRSFALRKAGKEDEAKAVMREVLEVQMKYDEARAKKKEEDEAKKAAAEKANSAAAAEENANGDA